jgi:Ala-tRNA(Pro) deacylase
MFDDRLSEQEEIYFEAGDHERLIQVSREDFLAMMGDAAHARFGERHWHH